MYILYILIFIYIYIFLDIYFYKLYFMLYIFINYSYIYIYIYIYIYKVISVVKWHPHIFAALWHLGVLTVIEDCTLFYTRLGPEEVLIHCYIW